MGFVLTYMLYTYSPHTDISHGGHLTYGLLFYLCVCVWRRGGGGGGVGHNREEQCLHYRTMDTSQRHITLSSNINVLISH